MRHHLPSEDCRPWSAALVILLVAEAVALVGGPLWAGGVNAVEVLRKAVLARGEVTYSAVGTITGPQAGPAGVATQVVFRKKGGRERIKMQDPAGRTLWVKVCDGETVWEHHVVWKRVIQRPLPDPQRLRNRELFNLKVLGANFNVQLVGTEQVAGRQAYRIRIGRPGPPVSAVRELWIDRDRFIELKALNFGPDGRLMHAVTLERVNFSPAFEPDTFTFDPPEGITPQIVQAPRFVGPVHAAAEQAGFPALPPRQVPPGFTLYSDWVTVHQMKGVTALWFQYTNGVRTFSVFQRQAKPDDNPARAGRGGMRTIRVGGYDFTVVGPLSPQEFDIIQAGYSALNR